jgi:uncharacterized repeat protein (TIGR01451 family)
VLGSGFLVTLGVAVLLCLVGTVPPASAAPSPCATPGADGPQPALGGIVNTYFPGTSASVAVGATSLTVGASIGASTPIAVGDKVLIIQMQSADLNATNTDAYGDGVAGEPPSGATNWASAGTYEFAVAANSVTTAGGTLQLSAGTGNTYVSSAATATKGQETFQVVRVPQYSSATLGGNVTATPWNGAAGGVVVLDVAGNLDLNGFRIDVSASGFRGGAARALSGGAGGANTDVRTSAANAFNGGKAEGVAGTPRYVFDGATTTDTGVEGYPNGSFARGAPADAGGGATDGNPAANDQNPGGGGGANGGAGGHGGNSWSSNLAIGGAGGAAVPAPGFSHVVLGGGGGGGTRNNAGPSSGGVGGGLVMLDIGSLTGAGEIRTNGGSGQTAANDGGGGGGAGGSVVVEVASGTLAGLTVNANGGAGGNAWPTQAPGGFPGERHGPGGGGGGGVTALSTTGATTSTTGGAHGITTTANDAYNATDGSGGLAGTFVGSLPGAGNASTCSPLLTVTKTTSTPDVTNTPSGTTATYTIAITNAAGRNTAQAVAFSDVLPTGFTFASTGVVTLGGGATRPSTSDPSVGATSPNWSQFTIPGGGSVSLAFSVDVASTVGAGTLQNPATATYLDPARTTVGGTTTASYNPASSTGEDVRVRWPDLTIAKSHSGTFSRGGSGTYALTATNSGDAASSGPVTVTDILPGGLTPTIAAGTGWTCGIVTQTVTCSRSDVLAGGASHPPITVTVTVAQSAAGSLTNLASVAGGNEQVTGNNTASDPTSIVGSADLAVTKSSSPNPYTAGVAVTYTIVVTNNGPSDVSGGVVADTLPLSLTAPTWTCVVAPADGVCAATSGSGNIATTVDLKSGTSATFIVSATVAGGTVGVISNTVTVTPPGGVTDPIPGNNSATDTNPTVPVADLAVTKTSAPDPYVAGSPLTYTVTVTNNGPADVAGAAFADTVPAQVTAVSWTCAVTGTGSCGSASGSGNGISTTVDLANGAVAAFAISGTVSSGAVGPISNTASVSAPSGTTDPSPGNNSATNDNPAGSVQADPQIGISPASSSGSPGGSVTVTADVSNNGPNAAQNVQTIITVPPSFSVSSATGTGWSCSVALNFITCDFAGALAASTVAPAVTLQLTLPGTAGGYALTATVSSSTPDTNNANNTANAAVTVSAPQPPAPPRADLSLTKTISSAVAESGDQISYLLAVHNNGPDPAADLVITDTLPAGLTFVSATGDGWVCTNVSPTITCSRAQLALGATSTVTLVVTTAAGGTIANTAGVSASTNDPTAANDVASATVSVTSRIDLAVSKVASALTFVPGKPLAFTIVVRNTGPDDVAGALVRDVVPAALNGFAWACAAVLAQCGDLAGSGSILQTVGIQAGGRLIYRLTGPVTQQSVETIVNQVTVSAPAGVVDADLSNNAATARVRRGVVATRLEVAVSPAVATVASGAPQRFVVKTTNTGAGAAKGVVTCIMIPVGASIARAAGGYVTTGRYCWRRASLRAGETVPYVIFIRGDRRQAEHLALVASAVARNASATFAQARLNVLAAVTEMTGGYTG